MSLIGFSDIWLGLHQQDSTLFPVEQIIRDSALFKVFANRSVMTTFNAETAIMNAMLMCFQISDSSPFV